MSLKRLPILRGLAVLVLVMLVASPAHAANQVFEIVIADGELVDSADTIRVSQGDHVQVTLTSDDALDLHLHGYDREVTVTPQSPALLELEATISGRFPVEVHGGGHDHGHVLFYLEVYPD